MSGICCIIHTHDTITHASSYLQDRGFNFALWLVRAAVAKAAPPEPEPEKPQVCICMREFIFASVICFI